MTVCSQPRKTASVAFPSLSKKYSCHLRQVQLTLAWWTPTLLAVNMYPVHLPSNYMLSYFIASEVLCPSEILFVNEMGFDI